MSASLFPEEELPQAKGVHARERLVGNVLGRPAVGRRV